MTAARGTSVVHFGVFDLDRGTGELTRSGRRVPLTPQAFELLSLLVARGGELVTRDEIRSALWGENTVVEFEPAVNACISQIRTALGTRRRRRDSSKPFRERAIASWHPWQLPTGPRFRGACSAPLSP